jgi:hypothetical protein
MQRPLKVLLTTDAVGGVWQYTIDLSRALQAATVEPIVAHLGPAPNDLQSSAVDGIRVIATGLPVDWLCDGPTPVHAAGEAIAQLADREAVDCVHLNMPTLAARAVFSMPVVAVTHGCVATWWRATQASPLPAPFQWHRILMEQGLVRADAVVAPTAAYGAVIAREYSLRGPPVTVLNGRASARPGAAVAPMRDHAFTAGRMWDRAKNGALLDRVASRLKVPFFAAGPLVGPQGETIQVTSLRSLGVLDEQTITDWLSHRPVFVSAAVFEPFGLAVLEAASAGCALVLSDILTFRELWDGVAIFVPANDDRAFVGAIERLINDRHSRVRYGDAARERARAYTPGLTSRAMAQIYRGLVASDARQKVSA